jgi:capsular exopolysaccharide synthesis family protein
MPNEESNSNQVVEPKLMNNQNVHNDELGNFIYRFFRILFLHKWLFLIVMVFIASLVLIYALQQPKIFRANHEVFYNETMREYVSLENSPVIKSDFDKNYWLKAMTSNEVMRLTLENSSLNYSVSQLKSMFFISVIDKRKEDRIPVYMVQITSTESAHLPILIRAYVKSLNDMLLRNQIQNSERLISYLTEQLNQNNQKLSQIDFEVLHLRSGGGDAQILDLDKVGSTLDKFRADLLNAQVNLSSIVAARMRTEMELKNLDGTVINESAFSEPLKVQLMNLEVDLARSLTRNKEDHPEVKQIRKNISQISEMIRDTLQQRLEVRSMIQNPIKNQLISKLMELKIQEVSEEMKVSSLQKIIAELETKSLPININEEQQQILRNREMVSLTIKQLNERLIETQTTSHGSLSRFVFIDDPSAVFISNKGVLYFILLALLLGFVVASIVVFIYDLLDDRIMLVDDYERFYKYPVVGLVRHFRNTDNYQLEIEPNTHYNYKGELSSLIVRLRQLQRMNGLKTLVVSSPDRREGKSLISLRLAVSLAQKKQKVLLIDVDFFAPKLSQKLYNESEPGLSNYLQGESSLEQIVKHTQIDNFDFICAGNVDGQKELFYSDKGLPAFFKWAKENYDVVLFDTPAAIYIPDIVEFFEQVDGLIIIARLRRTTRKALNQLVRTISGLENKFVAAIINDFQLGQGSTNYSYYNYNNYNNTTDNSKITKTKRPIRSILFVVVISLILAVISFFYFWKKSEIFTFGNFKNKPTVVDTIPYNEEKFAEESFLTDSTLINTNSDSLSDISVVE